MNTYVALPKMQTRCNLDLKTNSIGKANSTKRAFITTELTNAKYGSLKKEV